jgi:hypothetical protein
MIELPLNLPLPLPSSTPGAPAAPGGQAAGHADFSQWLSGSPESPVPGPPGQTVPSPTLPGVLPEAAPMLPPTDQHLLPVPGLAVPDPGIAPQAPASLPPLQWLPDVASAMSAAPASFAGDGLRLEWTVATITEPGAAVQLIASPWRLAAGDRLSQELHASLSLFLADSSPANIAAPTSAMGAPESATPGLAGAAGLRPSTPALESAITGLPLAAAPSVQAAATAAADEAGSRSAAQAHAAHWPLRLLRWLNDSDSGKTLWLRDFTVESGSADGLVDDLRRFAQAEKLPLARIVLNGRTLWSADTSLRDST